MDLEQIEELAENPEYATVESFIQFCVDDERVAFTHIELRALALNTKTSGSKVRTELEAKGLGLQVREIPRKTRGFTANSHDRWVNSGNHGGSGGDQILGFAGRKG
jgi:hypothetical protein